MCSRIYISDMVFTKTVAVFINLQLNTALLTNFETNGAPYWGAC